MKYLILLALVLLLPFGLLAQITNISSDPIQATEVSKHIGKKVTVTGTVFGGRYFAESASKLTLLNIGAAHPNASFTIVIPPEIREKFPLKPETELIDKLIFVTGTLTDYKGKPQIVIKSVGDLTWAGEMVEDKTYKEATRKVAPAVQEDQIFTFVEQQPEFPGGRTALGNFYKAHIKINPNATKASGIIIVQFVVNKEGKVSDPAIPRKLDFGLDEEVIRITKLFPNFKPGIQNGKPVAFWYTYGVKVMKGVIIVE